MSELRNIKCAPLLNQIVDWPYRSTASVMGQVGKTVVWRLPLTGNEIDAEELGDHLRLV